MLLVDFGGVQEVVSTSATDNAFGTTIVGTAGTHPGASICAVELGKVPRGWLDVGVSTLPPPGVRDSRMLFYHALWQAQELPM